MTVPQEDSVTILAGRVDRLDEDYRKAVGANCAQMQMINDALTRIQVQLNVQKDREYDIKAVEDQVLQLLRRHALESERFIKKMVFRTMMFAGLFLVSTGIIATLQFIHLMKM